MAPPTICQQQLAVHWCAMRPSCMRADDLQRGLNMSRGQSSLQWGASDLGTAACSLAQGNMAVAFCNKQPTF